MFAPFVWKVRSFFLASNPLSSHSMSCACVGFGPNEMVIHLSCFHLYHEACLKNWLKVKNTCPLCRASAVDGALSFSSSE